MAVAVGSSAIEASRTFSSWACKAPVGDRSRWSQGSGGEGRAHRVQRGPFTLPKSWATTSISPRRTISPPVRRLFRSSVFRFQPRQKRRGFLFGFSSGFSPNGRMVVCVVADPVCHAKPTLPSKWDRPGRNLGHRLRLQQAGSGSIPPGDGCRDGNGNLGDRVRSSRAPSLLLQHPVRRIIRAPR